MTTTISRIHRIPTSFCAAAALLLTGAAGAAGAEIEARMGPATVGKPVLVCRPTSDLDRAPFLVCWRTAAASAVMPQGDGARRSLRGRPATDAADLLDD